MKTWLMETYVGSLDWADVKRLLARAARRRAVSRHGPAVLPLWTILIDDDETCLCLVRASDVRSVERMARAACLQPDRIVEVTGGPSDLAPAGGTTSSREEDMRGAPS